MRPLLSPDELRERMSLRIVWTLADGSTAITHPVESPRVGETEVQMLDRLAAQALIDCPVLSGATRRTNVDDSTIPARTFRGAWRFNSGSVQVNIALARTQKVNEIKAERNRRLTESDKLILKYTDIGTAQQQLDIRTFRQALRDLPTQVQADIAAMTAVAQLIAYVPPYPADPPGVSL